MKTTLKSIFTLSILILITFFSSCEADKEIIEKNPSNGIIARRYSLQSQEGKANYKLNKAINQIKDIQSNTQINSRVVFNPIAGLLFDDEKGLYIQLDEKQSYTFPVIDLNPNAKVENICFNEKTDGNFDIYLVKYDFTKEEYETLTREELEQRQTVVEAIAIDGFEVSIESVTCIQILQFIPSTAVTPLDEGELTGNFGTQNGSGTWVTLADYCFEENDDVGGDNGFNNGFGTGGTDTGSDNGGGNGTGDGGVITGSVIDNTETTPGNTPVGVMIDLFKSTLEPNQLNVFNTYPQFASYLASNNCSPNSMNTVTRLLNYIEANNNSSNSINFALELFSLAQEEEIQADVDNLINIVLLVENSGDTFFTDEFELSLDPYVDLDLGGPTSTFSPGYLTMNFFLNYSKLRGLNPEWSRGKCAWEAGKEIIHLSLDIFGTIPVFGEPADLVNGVLYVIEGDGVNATLSFAGSVPVFGWAATGTKFGLKVVNVANDVNTRVKLVWKIVGDVIQFGDRAQLRKVLNLLPGNPLQAHHLIPWSSQTKMAVQRAAKYGSAFHMNEALNGIAVAAWRNQPNHQTYNNVINGKLDAFRNSNPNATPQECYEFITDLIQDIRTWVVNNPNSHLNEIVLP